MTMKPIYITDFVDEVTKTIFEIKPNSVVNLPVCISKRDAAIKWCRQNGYTYKIIGDEYFYENVKSIDLSTQCDKIRRNLKKFL